MSFKFHNEFRPSQLPKSSRVLAANSHYIEDLIGSKRKTLALVYGYIGSKTTRIKGNERKCVWLIGEDDVVAGDALPSDTELEDIWSGLDVEVVGRNGSPMRIRQRGEACPVDAKERISQRSSESIKKAQNVLRKLSQAMLPASVRKALEQSSGIERLVIVPVKDFRALPFSALPLGGRTLIDRFSIVISSGPLGNFHATQDGTNLKMLQSFKSERLPKIAEKITDKLPKYLVVGNPDLEYDKNTRCWKNLPYAEREAINVSSLLGVKPLLRSEANFDTVSSLLQKGQRDLKIVFFATHGISDSVNPADESFLALNGRHLRGADLRNFRFEGDPLVVMSACETGLGKTFADGMFGLVEAWRFAGASQVVMSLWDVDDQATAVLMGRFMKNFKAQGFTGAEYALSSAIRATKENNPDPAIWAAFSVIGKPTPD